MAYADFQMEIYLGGLQGVVPEYPLAYRALQRAARRVLSDEAFDYVAGSAGSEDTLRANREAFRKWRLVPRLLRDVSVRDVSTRLFDVDLPAPVLLAPVGVQSIVHPEAEIAVARAAAELGLPLVLSTLSSKTLEEVATASGDNTRWFQLYWPNDKEITTSFLHRAEQAGYSAVVVTLDTAYLAWRPRDLSHAFLPFLRGEGIANFVSDPVFRSGLAQSPEEDPQSAVLRWASVFSAPTHSWAELAELRAATRLPILLKGIQHPDDARAALNAGVDGLIVSNHGGRQVDGAVGSLDSLPAIAEAVAGRVPVLFDSGIRTGADIVKARALGADAVLVGRPYVWGLAIGGDAGVKQVLRALLAEMDLTLALTGCSSWDDVGPDLLVPL
ncbi:MAG TPA: alpha-hydroxy-acid oxidizing protein [Actinomycetota bacterium]|nr:alpha-hydroxy-acid oxidizing protein [Actinomycetota bacterium]